MRREFGSPRPPIISGVTWDEAEVVGGVDGRGSTGVANHVLMRREMAHGPKHPVRKPGKGVESPHSIASIAEERKMDNRERIIRKILEGFVNDPPDTPFQQGFLEATLVIAMEVFDVRYEDPLWQAADAASNGTLIKEVIKEKEDARKRFSVIDGGRTNQ